MVDSIDWHCQVAVGRRPEAVSFGKQILKGDQKRSLFEWRPTIHQVSFGEKTDRGLFLKRNLHFNRFLLDKRPQKVSF